MLRSLCSFTIAATMTMQAFAQDGALKGIETADLDRKVDACSDFYEFANGTWRRENPIPASMGKWSRRWAAGEANKEKLETILNEVSHQSGHLAGSAAQLIGDFYAACIDEKPINAAGAKPLALLLERIDAIRDTKALVTEIIELNGWGLAVPISFYGNSGLHDPQNVIAYAGAGGLGLPDRDYYVKPDQRFADARAGYLKHVAHILELAGSPAAEASAAAQKVMTLETALAKASLDNVALRDPAASDHKMRFEELEALTPHFDWPAFYASHGITPAPLNVSQPEFLKEVERRLVATSISDWKTYLRWQVLNNFADNLSQPFVEANFEFFQKQLAGVGELKPRPIRCSEQADQWLGEALGQEYVKRYFPPEAKARARALVTNILAAMQDSIETLDWMTPETKQKALEKLKTVNVKVGYPDKWQDYPGVVMKRDDYFGDVLAGLRFQVKDNMSTIGKPVDRKRWGMTPPTSDAYYNPLLNEIVFPAGILQPPAFSLQYTDAVNYGAIGVVIGHEISHGFDDEGAKFDAQGRLRNWWQPEDEKKFHAKTACVAKQFDGYSIDGDKNIHINGKLTLGESIGDLGGLKISYMAFQKTAEAKAGVKVDGFTPNQQFFIAWGQFRGDETRPETQKLMVQGDPHPVAKYRVIGPVSNFAAFAQAFQCKPGSKMVRPPDVRCVVW